MRAVGAVRVKASVNRNVKGGGSLGNSDLFAGLSSGVGGLVLPPWTVTNSVRGIFFFFFSSHLTRKVTRFDESGGIDKSK